jgi:NAD(P)-dependent dehydrogenase (short-subunit alcohol dehydrogenase family)
MQAGTGRRRPRDGHARPEDLERSLSRIIVITGAGAGLGRWLAKAFAEDGHQVVALGRTASKVESVARECGDGALGLHCDVSDPDSVRAAFAAIRQRYGRVDVLINNAALYEPFTITEARDDQITGALMTNLAGPIFTTREAVPLLPKGGQIINVSSESVHIPFPMITLYQCAKAGLERFSKSMADELRPAGVRVTVVRAGKMYDEAKTWDIDPEVGLRFRDACAAAGVEMAGAVTHFRSLVGIFRTLIDLPPDLHADTVSLHAWGPPLGAPG